MTNAPLILLLIGIVLLWTGLTGRLGSVLGAVFTPGRMDVQ